jgi:hypothetical protein
MQYLEGYFNRLLPSAGTQCEFKVYNISTQEEIEFAFAELDGNDGCFSIDTTDGDNTDIIMLLEKGNSENSFIPGRFI